METVNVNEVPTIEASPTVRAVVIDDATVIRESIPALMNSIAFVGSYAHVEAMLAEMPTADLVVLDLHLVNSRQPSAKQGIAAIRAAVQAGYRVCVYSQEERRFVLAACMAAGATGVVSKASSTREAEQAFHDVAAGRIVVPQQVIGLMEVLVRRDCITILGERQRQVLAGRARGLTYAEMSQQLYISESTLRGYWREVTTTVSAHLQQTTPSDIEHALGLGPGDLLDFWPTVDHPDRPSPASTPPREWWRIGRRRGTARS